MLRQIILKRIDTPYTFNIGDWVIDQPTGKVLIINDYYEIHGPGLEANLYRCTDTFGFSMGIWSQSGLKPYKYE